MKLIGLSRAKQLGFPFFRVVPAGSWSSTVCSLHPTRSCSNSTQNKEPISDWTPCRSSTLYPHVNKYNGRFRNQITKKSDGKKGKPSDGKKERKKRASQNRRELPAGRCLSCLRLDSIGMVMDPEMMRLAEEQMGRMSPADLRQDAAAGDVQSLPEDFAAMKAQADAQMSYAISAAKMLKQQGNELHGRGQYTDAAAKYKLAKDNLNSIPSEAGQTLQQQCALNLMSCYLSKAHEISPEDETIAQVLRDAEEKLAIEGGGANLPKGVVIEEIVEEEDDFQPSSPQNVAENPDETDQMMFDQPPLSSPPSTTDMQDIMRNFMEDPAMRQMLAPITENMSPDMIANMNQLFGIKPSNEDAAKPQQAISSLSLQDLDRMMKWMHRAQRGVEIANKTKNWLIARKGLIIAIVMLILAFILHRLGFIGS